MCTTRYSRCHRADEPIGGVLTATSWCVQANAGRWAWRPRADRCRRWGQLLCHCHRHSAFRACAAGHEAELGWGACRAGVLVALLCFLVPAWARRAIGHDSDTFPQIADALAMPRSTDGERPPTEAPVPGAGTAAQVRSRLAGWLRVEAEAVRRLQQWLSFPRGNDADVLGSSSSTGAQGVGVWNTMSRLWGTPTSLSPEEAAAWERKLQFYPPGE